MFTTGYTKKILILTLLLLVGSLMSTGCAAKSGSSVPDNIKSPAQVKIGVINSKALPPQVVVGFQKGTYKKVFPQVNFQLALSKGHKDVAKNLAEGNWDFAYLGTGPAIEFTNYGFDQWGPAKYTIIAGAQLGTNVLLTRPEVNRLSDLDGKTVGIANMNHDKEMLLNKLLAEAGLKSEPTGGTVKIKYGHTGMLYNEFISGQIQAIYPLPSVIKVLKQDAGAKALSDGSETEFGKNQTFAVFAVSNRFLKEYPEFTKGMIRVHVDNTELAQKNFNEIVELTLAMETDFFKDDPRRVIPKAEIEQLYKRLETTYDPNLNYLKETYRLLQKAKYINALPPFGEWADFTLLNQVLQEKGLDPI